MAKDSTRRKILAILADGKPRSSREIARGSGLDDEAVQCALRRAWMKGLVLRTEKPLRVQSKSWRGPRGVSRFLRSYHMYSLRLGGEVEKQLGELRLTAYDPKLNSVRRESKAGLVLDFLRENLAGAWYSTEIVDALKERNIGKSDVMSNVRRFENKGLVYVRGYRSHDGETPFTEGYLLTWIDRDKPREAAICEAVQKTERKLKDRETGNPLLHRIHRIRDLLIEASQLRDLASFNFLQSKLGCTEHEAEVALKRTLQLYPDMQETKLFDAYRYYYHTSLADADLTAAIKLKENYIRKTKGKANRIGHNWEACVEWFIDEFTSGARFLTQAHREGGMDPRRITIHLMKPVGRCRHNSELDRVWEVTPTVFAQPITYVLECKWGLVTKTDLDHMLEVLKWSKEFGVDTPDGRQVKNGVITVFAGNTFKETEKIKLKNGEQISLPTYAQRMNIQLLKAADLNKKLHEHSTSTKTTVQKICRICRDEDETREILEAIWKNPPETENLVQACLERNKELYEFEKQLDNIPNQ